MATEPDLPEGFEDLPPDEQMRMAHAKARKMLDGLLEARREAESKARSEGKTDQPGYITGRHAMDQAIASTRRMLEALESLIQDMGLDDESAPPPTNK